MRLVSDPTPALGDVGKQRLPSGALGYLNARSMIEMSTAFAAAVGVACLIAPDSWRIPLVVGLTALYALLVVVDLLIINRLIVQRTSYTTTSEFIYITKGAVLRTTVIVPIDQVLSVDTVEGPLLSRRGFANAHSHTRLFVKFEPQPVTPAGETMTLTIEASPPLESLSFRHLLSEITGSLPALLPLATVAVLSLRTSGAAPLGWLWAPLAVIVIAGLAVPSTQWVTGRYHVGQEGIWLRSGIVRRTTRFVAWTSVGAVEVDRPWYSRLWGLAKVTIIQGGDQGTRSMLPGVSTRLKLTRNPHEVPQAATRRSMRRAGRPTSMRLFSPLRRKIL
ncbi:MAG: hypothetical protein Q9187_009661 [Circinaria calcarea]